MTAIGAKELSYFKAEVRRLLMEAINDHDVAYRLIDGGHILLMFGGRGGPTIKMSQSRSVHDSVFYLTKWLDEHVPSWSARERPVEKADVAALAATLNTQPATEDPYEVVVTRKVPTGGEPAGPYGSPVWTTSARSARAGLMMRSDDESDSATAARWSERAGLQRHGRPHRVGERRRARLPADRDAGEGPTGPG